MTDEKEPHGSDKTGELREEEGEAAVTETTGGGTQDESQVEHGEAGQTDSHRMVEVGPRPGIMHNPYTTHGSPPEEDKTESGETPWKQASMGKLFDGEKISGPFVLGVLVLAAILFIGLMFASQHRQLRELRTRVDDIETHLEMQGVE